MANEENLKPVRTKSEARKRGRAGGIKSGETRAKRKTLKDELLLLLSTGNTQVKLSTALINQAEIGNTKAFEIIRDTIGEKPKDSINISGEVNNPFGGMTTEELRQLIQNE